MRKQIFGTKSYGDEEAMGYDRVNDLAQELYDEIAKTLVPSRETSLALTNVEQALMWADKSIRVNGVTL